MKLSLACAALAPCFAWLALPAAAQSERTLALEEIVVTARKQDESLQDAAVAVSAFSSEDIERLGAESLDDLARFTSGLSFSKAFGRSSERPVVRGLSNVLANVQFGVESGAAYFVDGIYYSGDVQGINLDDIERVEVVKGAQSALYGRNSYSGAINFITKGISEEPEARVKVGVGAEGYTALDASWSGQLSDSLGLRVTYGYDAVDGEWNNLVTNQEVGDEETNNLSLLLDWKGDGVDMRWRVDASQADDGQIPTFLQPNSENNCYPRHDPDATETSAVTYGYFCGAIKPRPIALNSGPYTGTDAELAALITELGYSMPFPASSALPGVPFAGQKRDVLLSSWRTLVDLPADHLLTLNVAYRSLKRDSGFDSDHSPINVQFGQYRGAPFSIAAGQTGATIANTARTDTEDHSLEAIFTSPEEEQLRWRAGLYVFSQREKSGNLVFTADGGYNVESPRNLDVDSLRNQAVFGSVSYDFSEQLSLDVELRWQEDRKTADSGLYTGDWEALTPRLTLTYRPGDDTTLYGVFAQGAKPGGLNGSAGANVGILTYEQEESTGIELGFKRLWADGRFLSNIAVYFNDINELQGTEPVPTPTGASTSIARNSGEGEIMGLEVDLRWQALDSLRFGLNFALTNTEFTAGCDDTQWRLTSGGGVFDPNFPNGMPLSDPSATTSTVAANNPNGQGDCSIIGNEFAFSPKTQMGLSVDYERSMGWLGRGGNFFASLTGSYESKKYAQVHNGAYVDAATLVGLRLGVRTDRWTLALDGSNLTDEDAPTIVTRWLTPIFGNYPRSFFATAREGQRVNLSFAYNF